MPEETPVPSGGLFDKLARKAKQAVGRIAGNHDLAEEGSLQAQKANTAIEVTRLQAEADQAEREPEVAAERERNQVEQARVEAEIAERGRTEQIAGEERAAKADVAELTRASKLSPPPKSGPSGARLSTRRSARRRTDRRRSTSGRDRRRSTAGRGRR